MCNHRPPRAITVHAWRIAMAGVLALHAVAAPAQTALPVPPGANPSGVSQEFLQDTQRWIESAVAAAEVPGQSLPLRMEVQVGALDSRLRLAPCNRIEPYLPPGTRLWGRSRIGLRCLDGATRWSVFLPVTIKAYGKAWVLNANINAGAVLTSADASEAEVDWAEEPSPVVLDSKQWVGAVASRSLGAGQTLRQSTVRAATVFSAGAQVRAVARGNGFAISTDVQALTPGVIGQSVRLRTESGRMLTGQVLDARTVVLDL